MTTMDELKVTFFQESEGLLEELADGLEQMSDGAEDREIVNSVFRAVHSIKGGAGAFSIDEVVRFAHRYENTLDALRNDSLTATAPVLEALMAAADHLAALLEAARDGTETEPSHSDSLIARLAELTGEDADAAPEAPIDFAPMTIEIGGLGGPKDLTLAIWFRPHAALYDTGNEAAFLLREVADLGDAEVRCDTTDLPEFEALNPNGAYLSWNVTLTTEASETAAQEVFEFVEDVCDLTVGPADAGAPAASLPELPVLTAPDPVPEAVEDTPDAEVEAEVVSQKSTAPAGGSQNGSVAATIRVELNRIDRMINLVGELVINQAMLTQCVRRNGYSEGDDIDAGLDELRTLTRQIQDSVMAIRAQPVKALFQRMSRIAREAGNEAGKSVRIATEGAATEIDKTVIEKLADPLTHMIRNAVDHGLETAEVRAAGDKETVGTITLSASHMSGRVVIEISDNGAGINRERVRQIAVDKGLIAADAPLTPAEIDNLIFAPGFSTATTVSSLSGRGVGMDVVKRAIQSLGGRVTIASEPGQGSTFTINLPLTLAVLDGMVVEVGGQTVVVPISAIIETMRLDAGQFFGLGTDSHVVRIRGNYVPILDVGAVLGYRAPVDDPENRVFLLVETAEGSRSALLIDAIHDQRQVVIKGLETNYGQVDGVAAATILGDGRIALILDPAAIVTGPVAADTAFPSTFAEAG